MARPQPRTALVAESDPFLQSLLTDVLANEGYEVTTARNGWQALRKARLLRPDFIALDLRLPEISGAEVLRVLAAEASDRRTPVLVLSPDGAGPAPAARGLPTFVVDRPHDRQALVSAVRAAVN
jgi:DNA-binding response OmpR family regulator